VIVPTHGAVLGDGSCSMPCNLTNSVNVLINYFWCNKDLRICSAFSVRFSHSSETSGSPSLKSIDSPNVLRLIGADLPDNSVSAYSAIGAQNYILLIG